MEIIQRQEGQGVNGNRSRQISERFISHHLRGFLSTSTRSNLDECVYCLRFKPPSTQADFLLRRLPHYFATERLRAHVIGGSRSLHQ